MLYEDLTHSNEFSNETVPFEIQSVNEKFVQLKNFQSLVTDLIFFH